MFQAKSFTQGRSHFHNTDQKESRLRLLPFLKYKTILVGE